MNAIGRRIIVAAALLGSLLAAVPATGHARAPKERRFVATVEGKQTSTWFKPRTYGTRTCFGSSWVEGEGTQEFSFKSKLTKVLAYESGKSLYFNYNTFRRDGYEFGIKVPIKLSRSADNRVGEDPGQCGGGAPTRSTGPWDCGTKTGIFEADINTNSLGNLELAVGTAIGYPWKGFSTCPFTAGPGVSDPFTTIDQPFSKKKLFSSGKAQTIKARASFEDKPGAAGSSPSRTTGVTWTLKLKPVAKK